MHSANPRPSKTHTNKSCGLSLGHPLDTMSHRSVPVHYRHLPGSRGTIHKSEYIALIASSIACNTSSDKLYQCINACLIFATQNHGDSLPHDAGCESNATLRPKLSRTFTHQCLHAHQCKRVAESSNKSSLTPVPFLHAILYIEVKY